MSEDANQATEARRPERPSPVRPTAEESRRWLETQVWTLPLLNERSADEILGDGDQALC